MKTREYRELVSLMIDGAVVRSGRGDRSALDLPGHLVVALRESLLPGEWEKLLDVLAMESDERHKAHVACERIPA